MSDFKPGKLVRVVLPVPFYVPSWITADHDGYEAAVPQFQGKVVAFKYAIRSLWSPDSEPSVVTSGVNYALPPGWVQEPGKPRAGDVALVLVDGDRSCDDCPPKGAVIRIVEKDEHFAAEGSDWTFDEEHLELVEHQTPITWTAPSGAPRKNPLMAPVVGDHVRILPSAPSWWRGDVGRVYLVMRVAMDYGVDGIVLTVSPRGSTSRRASWGIDPEHVEVVSRDVPIDCAPPEEEAPDRGDPDAFIPSEGLDEFAARRKKQGALVGTQHAEHRERVRGQLNGLAQKWRGERDLARTEVSILKRQLADHDGRVREAMENVRSAGKKNYDALYDKATEHANVRALLEVQVEKLQRDLAARPLPAPPESLIRRVASRINVEARAVGSGVWCVLAWSLFLAICAVSFPIGAFEWCEARLRDSWDRSRVFAFGFIGVTFIVSSFIIAFSAREVYTNDADAAVERMVVPIPPLPTDPRERMLREAKIILDEQSHLMDRALKNPVNYGIRGTPYIWTPNRGWLKLIPEADLPAPVTSRVYR